MNDSNHGISNNDKEIKLKHVKVYDQLYQDIHNGTYPIGSQLPSEPDLALQMNVSRMTLRRALSLLQEDNLILNIRGKGNFIKDYTTKTRQATSLASNVQSLTNPIDFCSNIEWDDLEIAFRIEPPTDFITNAIQCNSVVVVIAERWYKQKGNDTAAGYTLSFIPIEMITKHEIDLNKPAELEHYMQSIVYNDSTTSHATFSHTTTGNFSSAKYTLAEHDSFVLILETIYDKNNNVMICNKHFIAIENFSMQISTKRK